MEDKDDIYKNLVALLRLFKNRPYHLAKYLMENQAFSEKFEKDILNSSRLNTINKSDDKSPKQLNFFSISQMDDYFQSLLDTKDLKSKTIQQLENELNDKLDNLIKTEKYEDAARLRDYMKQKGYKRKFNF